MRPIHNRMPAMLERRDEDRWWDPAAKPGDLIGFLGPYPAAEMTAYAVSPLVNSPRTTPTR